MRMADHQPGEPSELERSCRNLYDIVSRPFESPDSSLYYRLDVTAVPRPASIINLPGGIRDSVDELLHLTIDTRHPWRVMYAHDETDGHFVADSVSLPVNIDGDRQHITFKRFTIGYIPLLKQGDKYIQYENPVAQLEDMVYGRYGYEAHSILTHRQMHELLDEAGFRFSKVSGRDGNVLSRATLLSDFDDWTGTEMVDAPTGPGSQVLIKRTSVLAYGPDGASLSGSSLEAISEDVSDTNSRNQLRVHFVINGATVGEPSISLREITPSTEERTIAAYGPDAYDVRTIAEIELEPEIVDQIAEGFLEDLGDIA